MRRKNEVLDKISGLEEELNRLYERIPEDTGNVQNDLYLRIVRGLKSQVEGLYNLVELEEEE
tara:strand:+ start:3567 stop:3752 length:186 start_codon:yes stop_codon:yes gene_type:complete